MAMVFRGEQKATCPLCGVEKLSHDVFTIYGERGETLLEACWHCLAALPARIAELERKVAGLEMALASEKGAKQ